MPKRDAARYTVKSPRAATAQAATLVFVCLLAAGPLSLPAMAADDTEPPPTLPLNLNMSADWDVDTGGARNRGELTVRMRGNLKLDEGMSVTDPSAPPGVIVTYSGAGVMVYFDYTETVIQEHPPAGCPDVLAEYQGQGSFQLETVNTAMTSGLNIRRMGSLVPKEMLAFAPPEAKEMMIDYYDFFAVAKKQEVEGRKRGWNDCNFQSDSKEINVTPSTIRFRITDDGKMKGNRRWSVESSGTPSFQVRVSDLPERIERRPLVPEPGGEANTNYAISWVFGEVDPFVEIERREGEFWVPLRGEPVEVVAGERMQLRGTVYPEEKDPKKGTWKVTDDGSSARKKYIKKYHASQREGRVEHLDAKDLNQPEVLFFWVDEGTGTVEYRTTADGETLTGKVEFKIKKPKFSLRTTAEDDNVFGPLTTGDAHPGEECCAADMSEEERAEANALVEECKKWKAELDSYDPNNPLDAPAYREVQEIMERRGCTPKGLQYRGITFNAEPLDDSGGTVQYVQLLSRSITRQPPAESPLRNYRDALDGCYPYPMNYPPYGTFDAPGFSEMGGTSYQHRRLEFEMWLMFKPDGDGNEWIPLKKVHWPWAGAIRCDDGVCAEDTEATITPPSIEAPDASEYPEWTTCSMGS